MKIEPDSHISTTEIVKQIQFSDIFNPEDIQRLQDLFADTNGVASIITNPEGAPITKPSNFCRLCIDIIRKTEKGLANCYQSDAVIGRQNPAGPVVQPCLSGGLWDGGASITVGGKHIANWLIGQVRNDELDEQKMMRYADEIGANRIDFMEALNQVPVMSLEQFNKVSQLLFTFANELSEKAYNNLLLHKQIAERKWAEEEIRRLNQELEQRVIERTEQLEFANKKLATLNQTLEISIENLNSVNATKDKFFSIIAHDLRSPFNSFLGLTEIMVDELPSLTMDEIHAFLVDMKNSASNLFRLLENLLHWARMQQGAIPFKPELLQLRQVVEECITTAMEPAKNKGIEIVTDIPDDLKVFADSNIIQTIIRNLVSNAMKYTHRGGKINLVAKSNLDNSVEVAVKDTGIGMNRKIVENLFRLDVKTSRKGTEGEPSTGLGLLLCKEFIEKHGGKILVESEEGKGSIFYFTVPANDDKTNQSFLKLV